MPFYLCTTPSGSLGDAQRQQIAKEITRIHCDETGAPPIFVHVAFVDAADPDPKGYSVFGTIRAGRTDQTKQALRTQMAAAVAETAGIGADRVNVHTVDVPASWVMEGGALLPEPGDEGEWVAAHSE